MNWIAAIRIIVFLCVLGIHETFSTVIEIEKPKDLKKTIATKTNLLVLYTSAKTPEVTNVRNVLKTIDGVVAFVDCTNNELKKGPCKKALPDGEKFILKHYKDGQFNKDYDRQMTKNSIQNFLRDPTGEIPFEEDPTGKDVVHLLNMSHLDKLMRKSSKFLCLFYTNWCGFCKKIKPFYSEIASEMKGKHVLAAMDMEKPENNQARRRFNITGFPTLLYFENNVPKYTFEGDNTKDGILAFLNNPSNPPVKQKEEEWAADPNSEIVHLTSKNFELILQEEKSAIVMFHANWCGHCKTLKPKYEAAAVKMKNKNVSGMLAAIDATRENDIASKYGVKGYPTLKYFEFGEFKYDVSLRDTDTIVKFMENPDEPPIVEVEKEVAWEDEETDVVFLTDETFKPFLKKKKHVLVFFFAPWCYHCKNTKPEFIKAAKEFKEDQKIEFAAVDCTKYSGICSVYEVRGYPTLKYFSYLKTQKDYVGGRTADDFIKFMQNPEKEVNEKPKVDIVPFTSDNVIILTDKTFDSTLKKHNSVMVFFFTEWCGYCKQLKPIYSKTADMLVENNKSLSILAAIDCSSAQDICKKFKIEGYPTVKYFKNGKFFRDYNKERTTEAIIEFLETNNSKDEL